MPLAHKLNFESIIQNTMAGLTVSFVALSLGAAFGILSGRGAFAGMLSAALIATITAAVGGTRIQTSGPTGPMTTVTALAVAAAHDLLPIQFPGLNPDHFINLVLILTGLLLLITSLLRLGRFISYVPNVVISGFMNGIAIIIWLDQIKKIFGLDGKQAWSGPLIINLLLTIISTVLIFTLPIIIRRFASAKIARLLSPTLVTLIVMTLASTLLQLPVEHVSLSTSLRSISDMTTLITSQWPRTWSLTVITLALPFAIQLTILAYLDTLLTSLVIDKMTGEKTRQNKELAAQGAASLAVAAVGGIPGAQATIRSVLIIKEKATSRLAGILVGLFALIEMITLQDTINLIPQAVFSGILIKVGYDVFDWLPVRIYWKQWLHHSNEMVHQLLSRHDDQPIFVTNREFLLILGTTITTVAWNLNYAVAIFTALFYLINKLFSPANPMRDLKPDLETEGLRDEA